MKAKIKDFILTIDRKQILTLDLLEDFRCHYDKLRDKEISVEMKPYRKRRSLDANAYCWALIGKLAAKLQASPDGIYRRLVQDVGDNYEIIPVREDRIDQWDRIWRSGHVGRFTDDLGPCRRTDGYHNVRTFYGSSDYDTAQMSRLIDSVVEECKTQGIETMTPVELSVLKSGWGE